MPKLAITVPETYESITRPVALQVMEQLKSKMSIDEDTPVLYSGLIDTLANYRTTLQGEPAEEQFGQHSRLSINVTEEYLDNHVLSTAVNHDEHVPVFHDVDLDIHIKPIYRKVELAITVNYRARSLSEAKRWENEAALKSSMGREEMLHLINYSYQVPDKMLATLHYLHELRETLAPYNEDLAKWFRSNFISNITALATLDGKTRALTVPEEQVGVLGWFDFENKPEAAERDGEGSTYTASFTYKIAYDKLIALNMSYPIVIHNQLIDVNYRNDFNEPVRPTYTSKSLHAMQGIAKTQQPGNVLGHYLPDFEDWMPMLQPIKYNPLLTITCLVDPDNPHDLFNLGELGDYELDPDSLVYIKENPGLVTMLGEAPIYVHLYEGSDYSGDMKLTVDSDLNVKSVDSLNMRKFYHVRISLLNELTSLSDRGKEILCKYPTTLAKVIDALDPTIANRVGFPKTVGGAYVPAREFERVVEEMNYGGGKGTRPGERVKMGSGAATNLRMKTVGIYRVIARR